jgi:hypothetical protein
MRNTTNQPGVAHWRVSVVDVADGEYMLRKIEGKPTSIPQIEKMFGLKPGQLASYRANNYSRKPNE